GPDLDTAELAPVDLHRLGWLVVDLLVDTPPCRTDAPEIAANDDRAALISFGATGNLLANANCREIGILGQQGIDLGLVGIQEAGALRNLTRGRLVQLKRRGHRLPRAVESARNGPAGALLDLGQAADLGPQGDIH